MSSVRADEFYNKLNFGGDRIREIGIEHELIIVDDKTDQVVSKAPELIREIKSTTRIGDLCKPEISCNEVEFVTPPCSSKNEALKELNSIISAANIVADRLGLKLLPVSAIRSDFSVKVFPNERYQNLAKHLSREEIIACSRVEGVHFHITITEGWQEAIELYEKVRKNINKFLSLGKDTIGGQLRLDLFNEVIYSDVDPMPVKYFSKEDIYIDALESGWVDNPSDNWKWLKFSPRLGTLELRCLGSAVSFYQLEIWLNTFFDILEVELG